MPCRWFSFRHNGLSWNDIEQSWVNCASKFKIEQPKLYKRKMGNKTGSQKSTKLEDQSPFEFRTSVTTQETIIIWRITDFTKLQELESARNGKTSIYFHAGNEINRSSTWKLSLRFHQHKDDDMGNIGLMLKLKQQHRPWHLIYAKFSISILDPKNISKEIFQSTWSTRAWPCLKSQELDDFVSLKSLRNEGAILEDVLTVQVKVVVYGEQKMVNTKITKSPALLACKINKTGIKKSKIKKITEREVKYWTDVTAKELKVKMREWQVKYWADVTAKELKVKIREWEESKYRKRESELRDREIKVTEREIDNAKKVQVDKTRNGLSTTLNTYPSLQNLTRELSATTPTISYVDPVNQFENGADATSKTRMTLTEELFTLVEPKVWDERVRNLLERKLRPLSISQKADSLNQQGIAEFVANSKVKLHSE